MNVAAVNHYCRAKIKSIRNTDKTWEKINRNGTKFVEPMNTSRLV